jgi:hypothetical protein
MSANACFRQLSRFQGSGVYTSGEMKSVFTFMAFVVFLPAFGHAKEPVDTSVCAIAAHPSKFHNKTVRIRAAASSGMEAAFIMENKAGKWNKKCGRINLDFECVEHDETTNKFRELFGTQVTFPRCDRGKELSEGVAHIFDPDPPAPKLCFDISCLSCPRYDIVATFTGKIRHSGREPGHMRFGHLGMFNVQLDVRSVSNLDVTDTQPVSKP